MLIYLDDQNREVLQGMITAMAADYRSIYYADLDKDESRCVRATTKLYAGKMWEGKNGCSLNSYLASCSMHYFASRVKAEKKRNDREIIPSTPEIIEYLNHFTAEEENENQPVWEAYRMLKERDRVILWQLVIEEKDAMTAAPIIWPYINTNKEIHELSQKHVQSTIAMAKHRALLALLNKLKTLTSN
ncbi:MAG: hypothetical protein IIV89_06755 [Bacteroidaceae bacterium]|nr:hypothetical protein [Bacteroidaceae bacterium]